VQRHSAAEFDSIRPTSSSSLSGYLANQRFGPRPSEAEQMMQVKRRAAAQRERELRNYHQEQQYNRREFSGYSGLCNMQADCVFVDMSGAKSERSMSPSAMSEEDRRELIARQHRALYGNDSSLYLSDNPPSRPLSQDARVSGAINGQGSTGSFDQFGMSIASSTDNGASLPNNGESRPRAESTVSPSPNPNSFAMFDGVQQPSRASTSSPNGSSPPRQGIKASISGVAPIGTRPVQANAPMKRNTPPMSSPLGYGFNTEKMNGERSTSSASNPTSAGPDKAMGLGWGSTSGTWSATKNTLGVQASVWG